MSFSGNEERVTEVSEISLLYLFSGGTQVALKPTCSLPWCVLLHVADHWSGDHVLGDLDTVSALLRKPETECRSLNRSARDHEFRSLHGNFVALV
jgi:hypothetical protein